MNKIITGFKICLMLCYASLTVAQQTVIPNEGTTMTLGTGYNSLTGRDLDRCIVNELTQTLTQGDGAETLVTYEEIKTREQLNGILGLNSAASLGIGGFSGSSKVSFSQNFEFNRQTYYLAMKVVVKNQSQVLSKYKLSPEAKALCSSNQDKFLQVCGDEFVAARITGGEFIAIIRLETKNSTEKNKLSASFKAKYSAFNGKGSASASAEINKTIEDHNGTISVIRRGGVGELPEFWDPASLKEYSRKFPTEVSGENSNPIIYSITTKPFNELIDMVDCDLTSLTSSKLVIEDLAKKHNQALTLHQDINYIVSHPDQFISPNITELLEADTRIIEVLNKIRSKATICEQFPSDAEQCKFLSAEEVKLPEITLPKRVSGEFKLCRCKECGIEGYETKKIAKYCRTPENGMEIVETRVISYKRNSGGLPNHQNIDDVCEKYREKTNYYNKSDRRFREKTISDPSYGFDNSWKVQDTKFISWGATTRNPYQKNGGAMTECNCEMILVKYQPKLAQNEACGFEIVPDHSKPIYKECRHPACGYEK